MLCGCKEKSLSNARPGEEGRGSRRRLVTPLHTGGEGGQAPQYSGGEGGQLATVRGGRRAGARRQRAGEGEWRRGQAVVLKFNPFTLCSCPTHKDAPKKFYPKDSQVITPPMATLKCSHAKTSWTCADFFLLNDNLT